MENRWYKLDNAAKIYPAIRQTNWSPVFRVDAVLKEDVQPDTLQQALLMTYKRFPTFSVHIGRGLFWYYLEPNDSTPTVKLENDYPTRPFSEQKDKGYLFRVLYYKKRISLEVFHAICDGFGASVFLKTLLFNYLSIVEGEESIENPLDLDKYGILYFRDLPTAEETEDSFQRYAIVEEPLKLHENPAYRIKGTKIGKESLRLTHLVLSVSALQKLAKEYGCTITELLTSIYIYSIFNSRSYNSADKRPIKISVPVNLRRFFPSKTLRNFSSYINVEVFSKNSVREIEFKEICEATKVQLREGANTDILRMKFSGNVHAEKNLALRAAPLFLKDLILKSIYSVVGEKFMTTTLSNLGSIELPEKMSQLIERLDFALCAPKQNVINCAVISLKDVLSISFSSSTSENSILKVYVDFITAHGIKVEVETNY